MLSVLNSLGMKECFRQKFAQLNRLNGFKDVVQVLPLNVLVSVCTLPCGPQVVSML